MLRKSVPYPTRSVEAVLNCSSYCFLSPWACRLINHWSLWRMASRRASLLRDRNQIMHGNRGICVWTTCSVLLRGSEKAGTRTRDRLRRESNALTTTSPGVIAVTANLPKSYQLFSGPQPISHFSWKLTDKFVSYPVHNQTATEVTNSRLYVSSLGLQTSVERSIRAVPCHSRP